MKIAVTETRLVATPIDSVELPDPPDGFTYRAELQRSGIKLTLFRLNAEGKLHGPIASTYGEQVFFHDYVPVGALRSFAEACEVFTDAMAKRLAEAEKRGHNEQGADQKTEKVRACEAPELPA